MVKGGDSHSIGRGFNSQHWILDNHFFTLYWYKNGNVCLKETENKRKEAENRPFLKKAFLINND